MVTVVSAGYATGFVIGTDVHVLKSSRSSYGLYVGPVRHSYCCQDGCCDDGLRPDVEKVVLAAKERGATRVILRTGMGASYVKNIAGLPVSDVCRHVGPVEGCCPPTTVVRGWR